MTPQEILAYLQNIPLATYEPFAVAVLQGIQAAATNPIEKAVLLGIIAGLQAQVQPPKTGA